MLEDAALWAEWSGVPDEDVRGWLLFLDPFRMDGRAALAALAARSPGRPIIGGMASADVRQRRAWVFFDDQVYDEGGVALAIGGPYRLHPLVAQGGEPIGESWTITGVDRNTVLTISNRPATDVMQATVARLTTEARARAGRNLLVGFAADEYQDEFHRGDFLVRGVLGPLASPSGQYSKRAYSKYWMTWPFSSVISGVSGLPHVDSPPLPRHRSRKSWSRLCPVSGM